MKIYIAQLIVSLDELTRLSEISNTVFTMLAKGYDKVAIIYGWSTDKKIIDIFKKFHNNKFKYFSKNISKDDAIKFMKDEIENEIKFQCLRFSNVSYDIPLTEFEYSTLIEFPEDSINQLLGKLAYKPYSNFNNDIIDALDVLNYTYFHDMFYEVDEVDGEYASYNASYGLTPFGNKLFYGLWDIEADSMITYIKLYSKYLNIDKLKEFIDV